MINLGEDTLVRFVMSKISSPIWMAAMVASLELLKVLSSTSVQKNVYLGLRKDLGGESLAGRNKILDSHAP